MHSFLYRCPNSGVHIQAWAADDTGEPSSGDEYVGLSCPLCTRTHLVNPKTGHVLGENKPKRQS